MIDRCILLLHMKLKHKSRSTAVQNIKRMFANTTEDSISLQDVFSAWGRDLEKVEENKAWLSNKLTHLKYHDLVTPVYTYNQRPRRLERLELTLEGKRELGRIGGNTDNGNGISPTTNGHSNKVKIADVMEMVAQLKEAHKDKYEITFDVKLKTTG